MVSSGRQAGSSHRRRARGRRPGQHGNRQLVFRNENVVATLSSGWELTGNVPEDFQRACVRHEIGETIFFSGPLLSRRIQQCYPVAKHDSDLARQSLFD